MSDALIKTDGSAALSGARLLVTSRGIERTSTLASLLDDFRLVSGRSIPKNGVDAVLAWGRRPSASRAALLANDAMLPMLTIEDGFLRSVELGINDPPLSIVVDDIGIYYDASSYSRLECMIHEELDPDCQDRARRLRELWCARRVSKYNGARQDFHAPSAHFVLVVDQTSGDASVITGGAGQQHFDAMLQAAVNEHPECAVVVKVHPEVVIGRKKGHYDLNALRAMPRVTVLASDVHMADVLSAAQAVYVVTSQVGFEALLWNKPVTVFGSPFYSGWGLTDDRGQVVSRRTPVSLEQLVYAALVRYPRYVSPETGHRCTPEDVIEWIGLQRLHRNRHRSPRMAIGFSRWKRPFVEDFFDDRSVRFSKRFKHSPGVATLIAWGCKHDDVIAGHGGPASVVRVEDGFLRSVGLGADLIRPLSWVLDDIGIYYDARRMSRLEVQLCNHKCTSIELDRAASLRARIVSAGITKYNLSGGNGWERPKGGQRVILVPGQVESDASVRYGNGGITRNIELLETIRRENVEAYIVYKPHPDVVAGLRQRGHLEERALSLCNEVIVDVPLSDLFDQVDEVHVLTSLAGFEALMRRKQVVTYGQPFYAGWGLTDDRRMTTAVLARRGRVLTLDELVYATLVLYPTYVSRVTRRFTTPERILDELQAWRVESPKVHPWRRILSRLFKKK